MKAVFTLGFIGAGAFNKAMDSSSPHKPWISRNSSAGRSVVMILFMVTLAAFEEEGKVFDEFTGRNGMAIDEWKELWKYGDEIDFGF